MVDIVLQQTRISTAFELRTNMTFVMFLIYRVLYYKDVTIIHLLPHLNPSFNETIYYYYYTYKTYNA